MSTLETEEVMADRTAPMSGAMAATNSSTSVKNSDVILSYPRMKKADVISELKKNYPERAFCLLNVNQLRTQAEAMQESFIPEFDGRNVAYAVKANPCIHVLNILVEAGINQFDCASIEEIKLITALFPNTHVLYNHPIKHIKDIKGAASRGVQVFTVQSKREIDKVLLATERRETSKHPEIVVRLATQSFGARIPLSEKFGATVESTLEMLRYMKDKPIKYGLSIHIGSQNTDIEAHCKEIISMFSLARQVGGVDSINIGGGMPVNYDNQNKHCIKHYLKTISPVIMNNLEGVFRSASPRIYIEPGRAMVAESIDLIVPLMAKEIRNKTPCVYIDDGIFTSFSDALIHQWHYFFDVMAGDERQVSTKAVPMTIYGRTCDPGDRICAVDLPEDIREGDYLVLSSAGAYMDSQSTRFNGFKPPQYVLYNFEQ